MQRQGLGAGKVLNALTHSRTAWEVTCRDRTVSIARKQAYIISDICSSIPLTNVQSVHVMGPDFPSLLEEDTGKFSRSTRRVLQNLTTVKMFSEM